MKTSAELLAFCRGLEAPRAWTLKELVKLDPGEAIVLDDHAEMKLKDLLSLRQSLARRILK